MFLKEIDRNIKFKIFNVKIETFQSQKQPSKILEIC